VLEYWSDGMRVVIVSFPYASLQYSTTPILHVFYLGHHVNLRLDVASRDDMPLEVHLIGVKT
jgi:hypothetical protein